MGEDEKGFTELKTYLKKQTRAKSIRQAVGGREEEARATLIAADRLLSNASVSELARSYGLGRAAVIKALSTAERLGFYNDVEALIMGKLLPLSAAVYQLHLERGSLEAARDVMFGTGALRKNAEMAVAITGDTIEAYRTGRKESRGVLPQANSSDQGSPPDVCGRGEAEDLEPGGDAPQEH